MARYASSLPLPTFTPMIPVDNTLTVQARRCPMKSLIRGAVFGAIVLCATLALTESFGATCEEQEGQAFWDCYARVSNEALRPTVSEPTSTANPCEGLPEKQFAACMRVYLDQALTGQLTPKDAPAPRNAAGQSLFEQVMGAPPSAAPSSKSLTPYEQRRVEEQAAKTLYEDRVAQRAIEDLKYQRLHEEQRAQERQYREEDREDRREAARMQALGLFFGSGGFQSLRPLPPFQPQPPISMPTYQAPVYRPPVNCTSNRVGDYTYTNCN